MNYNLVLNDSEISLIWGALEGRPYREVVGLLETIRNQVNAQVEERSKTEENTTKEGDK